MALSRCSCRYKLYIKEKLCSRQLQKSLQSRAQEKCSFYSFCWADILNLHSRMQDIAHTTEPVISCHTLFITNHHHNLHGPIHGEAHAIASSYTARRLTHMVSPYNCDSVGCLSGEKKTPVQIRGIGRPLLLILIPEDQTCQRSHFQASRHRILSSPYSLKCTGEN